MIEVPGPKSTQPRRGRRPEPGRRILLAHVVAHIREQTGYALRGRRLLRYLHRKLRIPILPGAEALSGCATSILPNLFPTERASRIADGRRRQPDDDRRIDQPADN
jgi:hypothetical protein